MFQVVQPLALFALGTLAVPILIHLWRRPRTVVRVGSLRPFLAHRHPSRARTLHDWPLLLLRCAILAALGLAFAGLQWRPQTAPPVRWCLLLPGTQLRDTPLQAWTRRLEDGFEPRWLAPGFPRIVDLNNPSPSNPHTPVWPLLRQADTALPTGSEAWVFGPTWASLFHGDRPSLRNLRVQWHEVPTAPPITPPPPAPRVGLVHSPERSVDAAYLRAALQAIGASMEGPEVPSWIFRLGTAPLPFPDTVLERHRVRIVRDAPDSTPPEMVSRRLDVGSQTVGLRQRIPPSPGIPVMRDSHGEPWLTEEHQGSIVVWHVAFRFHPDWTDWPLEGAFPAWWQARLQPAPPATTSIAPEQAAPRFVPDPGAKVASGPQTPPPIDLRAGCWGLAAILFLLERRLSRGPTPTRAGPSATSAAPAAAVNASHGVPPP